ncbi:MAG: CBS domain-containing protein [Candidatus Aenigmatarchaeota archaeon]|nr:MAG: CBS domain-containing protein [Candidatus Aenigmarchaeota archaeon]
MKVKDIMVTDVVTLSPEDTFFDIVELFAEKKISGAPVVDGSRIVGLVSESDIMEFVSKKDMITMIDKEDKAMKDKASMKARDFMSKRVITVQPNDDLGKVIKLLDEKDINRVPVVDKKKIVGIITRADVVSVVSEYLSEHPAMRKMELQTEEPKLKTNIDRLLSLVKERGSVKLKDATKEFGVEEERIEKWGEILEEYKLVKMHYPPIGEPKISIIKEKKRGKKK